MRRAPAARTLHLTTLACAALLSVPASSSFSIRLPTFFKRGVSRMNVVCSAKAPADVAAAYDTLAVKLRKVAHLEGAMGLLGWDELTVMPAGAAEARGQQKAALAGVVHNAKVDPTLGELLKQLDAVKETLSPVQAANVRIAKEGYDRKVRMSQELAERSAKLESSSYNEWVTARKNSAFQGYAPTLKAMFDLSKEINSITKPEMKIYDAAIDNFDPKMNAERIKEIFDEVKPELTEMIKKIADKVASDKTVHEIPAALKGGPEWDPVKQAEMCKEIAGAIGFDFERGRMDVSVHPFTGGSHMSDVRITTRYSSDNWIEGIAGTIHECGHAMYEQGRSKDEADLPVSAALGMSVHESQSLLWERMVAQSLSFWKWATPIVHRYFPHTKECGPEDFYRVINMVQPSLIRVDADEVTYPMHVIIRFELEKGVMEGTIKVEDLPKLWNSKMKEYLGVVPPDDKDGVLQDVHWPSGAIGYFPSYSLGAMMSTQIYEAAKKDIPDLDKKIESGNFLDLRQWLNNKVHAQGSFHETGDDLLESVTGDKLQPKIFLNYLKGKYSAIYGI